MAAANAVIGSQKFNAVSPLLQYGPMQHGLVKLLIPVHGNSANYSISSETQAA